MDQEQPTLKETPSQTAGPFVHIGLVPRSVDIPAFAEDLGQTIMPKDAPGSRVSISGRVLDGNKQPVSDVLIEVWQADAEGHYDTTGNTGWGRIVPDFDTGLFEFTTIKPGAYTAPNGTRTAPHLSLYLLARGINLGLHTRLYFPTDHDAHAKDPVLSTLPPDRRKTLVAKGAENALTFDIVLQGGDETVFFDL